MLQTAAPEECALNIGYVRRVPPNETQFSSRGARCVGQRNVVLIGILV
jgi:hypothetical protein